MLLLDLMVYDIVDYCQRTSFFVAWAWVVTIGVDYQQEFTPSIILDGLTLLHTSIFNFFVVVS